MSVTTKQFQSFFISCSLAAILPLLSCWCGPGPNVGGYGDDAIKDPPKSLQGIQFVESEKADPTYVGCADGQREGFADIANHPRIAGCLASWEGVKSLRDKSKTPPAKPCGDDGEVCEAPADACAPGWHICGMDGKNRDLQTHTTWKNCNEAAGPGKFVAAMSHCQVEELCPPPPTVDTVFPCSESDICSEPVCCGNDCQMGQCRDAVWRGRTRISRGKQEGCGSVTSERNGGILCCYDGAGSPPVPKNPATASTESASPTTASHSTDAADATSETSQAAEQRARNDKDAKEDKETKAAVEKADAP